MSRSPHRSPRRSNWPPASAVRVIDCCALSCTVSPWQQHCHRPQGGKRARRDAGCPSEGGLGMAPAPSLRQHFPEQGGWLGVRWCARRHLAPGSCAACQPGTTALLKIWSARKFPETNAKKRILYVRERGTTVVHFLAVDRFADLSALDCNLPYCSQIPKSRSLENITLM